MSPEVKARVKEMAKEISLILGDLPDPTVEGYEIKELYKGCESETFTIKLAGSRLNIHFIRDENKKAGA